MEVLTLEKIQPSRIPEKERENLHQDPKAKKMKVLPTAEALKIHETDETPFILFDREKGIFEVTGRSLPEDSAEFFLPVLQWVKDYAASPNAETVFTFRLDYINTASSKFFQDIICELESIPNSKVVWYYHEDDESMEELGNEFAEIIHVPFELKSYH